MSGEGGCYAPGFNWPKPIAKTSRFEFWNNQTGPGVVIIRTIDSASLQVGRINGWLLRRALLSCKGDVLQINEVGNHLFEIEETNETQEW